MLRFYIPNMTCGGCAKSVTKALLSVDPQARIEPTGPRVKSGAANLGRPFMSVRYLSFVAAAAAFAASLLVPMSAAAGAYHPADGEAGATYHPDHASTNSRQQVTVDLDKAQKHPAWKSVSRGAPWPVPTSREPKTRDQVNAELKIAMQHPAWKIVSRGAPWPTVAANPK